MENTSTRALAWPVVEIHAFRQRYKGSQMSNETHVMKADGT